MNLYPGTKAKSHKELHPVGEGIFQIIKFVKKENGGTLIFSPLLKGVAPIPRTYYYFKESDIAELVRLGCKPSSKKLIDKFLEQLVTKPVLAEVGEARNKKYRNILSFGLIDSAPIADGHEHLY